METPTLLPPDVLGENQSAVPCCHWRGNNVALESRVALFEGEMQEVRSRLGQDSSNSSRPPSTDPPQAAAKRKQKGTPSDRKRGGQPSH